MWEEEEVCGVRVSNEERRRRSFSELSGCFVVDCCWERNAPVILRFLMFSSCLVYANWL